MSEVEEILENYSVERLNQTQKVIAILRENGIVDENGRMKFLSTVGDAEHPILLKNPLPPQKMASQILRLF